MESSLLLIDLSSIAHLAFYESGKQVDPDWTAHQTIARVHALASGRRSGVAVCLDTPPYFRKAIDADYKANRAKDNNAIIAHQIAVAVDALKADGFPVWGAAGYEADDIIATATKLCDEFMVGAFGPVVIASADKDMYALISDRVTVQKLSDGSRWDAEMLKAKAGIVPNQVVDYLALVGDTSDNIAGAKGIGPKTASRLLSECGNLDDLYHAIDGGIVAEGDLTPSVLKSLQEFRPRLNTVRELIRLRTDAPIPFDEIFKERLTAGSYQFAQRWLGTEAADGEKDMDATGPVDRGTGVEGADPHRGDEGQPEAGPQTAQAEAPALTAESAALVDAVAAQMGKQATPRAATEAITGTPKAWDLTGTPPKPKPDGPPESTALAPVEWERQLEPRDVRQVAWYAKALFASRLFAAHGTPEAVMSTILAGRELGFTMMASLRGFHVIDGKPTLSAGAIHSLVLRSGKAKFFRCVERTATKATFETQRGDDPPFTMSYTIEEAQQAWTKDQQAWNRSGWGKHCADMLIARCSSKLARLIYPDVVMGLYAPEEL